MHTATKRFFVLLFAAGAPFPAIAHGPMATDDAGTLDVDGMKVEAVLGREVEAYGEKRARPDKAIGLRYEILEGFNVYASAGRGNDRSFGNLGVAWEF
jgi:hypothetical protein